MKTLTSSQKKKLKGLAHHLDPLVIIGQKGITPNLIEQINSTLDDHELIKIRFNEFKEDKSELIQEIVRQCQCHHIATVGHLAILYKESKDENKRKIKV